MAGFRSRAERVYRQTVRPAWVMRQCTTIANCIAFRRVHDKVAAGGRRIGADGGTRTPTGFPPTDFHTIHGFRRRSPSVCGLDYPFTLRRFRDV